MVIPALDAAATLPATLAALEAARDGEGQGKMGRLVVAKIRPRRGHGRRVDSWHSLLYLQHVLNEALTDRM